MKHSIKPYVSSEHRQIRHANVGKNQQVHILSRNLKSFNTCSTHFFCIHLKANEQAHKRRYLNSEDTDRTTNLLCKVHEHK